MILSDVLSRQKHDDSNLHEILSFFLIGIVYCTTDIII